MSMNVWTCRMDRPQASRTLDPAWAVGLSADGTVSTIVTSVPTGPSMHSGLFLMMKSRLLQKCLFGEDSLMEAEKDLSLN